MIMAQMLQPGFKIIKSFERPNTTLVAQFQELVPANISDVQGRQNTMDARIKPIYQPMAGLCGPAVTVKARPGDNLVAFKAIEVALPGDVIVIAGAFDTTYSVWGGVMSAMAKRKGIAGMVTDGLVRDVSQTRDVEFPVFAIGLTPAGPTKDGAGQLNTPISCGGVVVFPGDIVVGDEDGVVVVRKEEAPAVLERTRARVERERGWFERIAQDELFLMNTDDDLRERGCEVID
jgi:regulator of RNase E activity RraA